MGGSDQNGRNSYSNPPSLELACLLNDEVPNIDDLSATPSHEDAPLSGFSGFGTKISTPWSRCLIMLMVVHTVVALVSLGLGLFVLTVQLKPNIWKQDELTLLGHSPLNSVLKVLFSSDESVGELVSRVAAQLNVHPDFVVLDRSKNVSISNFAQKLGLFFSLPLKY